jgi:hypothetical protein
MPLFDALGALHGVVDDSGSWHHFAAIRDMEKFDRLLTSGVLGGDATQLLGGVPKTIVRYLEGL